MLSLVTLGRLELSDDGAPLLARRRKELVLLAFVARRAPRPVSRAELAALLWGERDEARARQSLRQALSELRRVVGEPLRVSTDDIRLAANGLAFDVQQFEDAIASGNWAAAVRLWSGDFLMGTEELGHEELRSWIERERAGLRQQLAEAFARLVDESRSSGQSKAEIEYAAAWSEALPYDEAAHRRLVEALRLAGRTTEARARYAAFASRLRHDLGAEPSDGFARLAETLLPEAGSPRVGARGLLSPDLVGRAGILGRLTEAWRRTVEGEGGVIVVLGDEGFGKSRVCREFVRAVRQSDASATILAGGAFESERGRSWSTLRPLLAPLADARGLLGAPPSALAAVAEISPEIKERFPRLSSPGPDMPPELAVARVVSEVAAETPVLLVLDDAAAADSDTLAVLATFIRRPPASSLLVLATSREALIRSSLAADLREAAAHVTEVELQPLELDDVECMAESMMPLAPETSSALAERLYRESAGNPAQIERMIAAWADAGILSVGPDGRWGASRPLNAELPIPRGIRESVLQRVRQVPPESRRVVEAAAVWAGGIEPRLLEATSEVNGDSFTEALGALLSRRLLRESVRRPGTVEFENDTVRRAVYDALAPSRRRQLHRAAALALRAVSSTGEPDQRLAEHVALGGSGSTRRWWLVGGVAAAAALVAAVASVVTARSGNDVTQGAGVVLADVENDTGDPSLGRVFYTAATVGLQDSRHVSLFPRARVRETLARMRQPDADSMLTEPLAREIAIREGLASVIVLGVSQVDSNFLLTARVVDPAQAGDLSVATVRVSGRGALLGGLDRLLSRVRRNLGESPAWIRDSLPALPRVTTSSLEALYAYVDGQEAWKRREQWPRAWNSWQRAVALDSEFALAHAALANYYWFAANDRVKTLAQLDRALALRDRLTERERWEIRSLAASRAGRFEEAAMVARQLAERYPERGTWYGLGTTLLQAGRCTEAIPALRRAIALDSLYAYSHINLATCLQLEGDADGALRAYAAAAHADSLVLLGGNLNHEWGVAFVRANRLRSADSAYRLMLDRRLPIDRARGHRSLAWLAIYEGRYRDASTALRQAVSLSHEAGNQITELRNRTILAEVLAARGDRAGARAQLDTVAALAKTVNVEPAFHLYIGMAAIHVGRSRQSRAAAAALRASSIPGRTDDEARRRALDGELLLAVGNAAGARGVVDVAALHNVQQARAFRRSIEARALAALGRYDSALVAATQLSETFSFGWEEQFEWLRGSLLVGEYAEALGDTAAALAAYGRFAERWERGDPDLPDLVRARRARARLLRSPP